MNLSYLTKNRLAKIRRLVFMGFLFLSFAEFALSSPLYSRQYKVSCSACHNSPPQLNIYGARFRQTNSLPSWESNTTIDTGDMNTAVPKIFPFSVHSQMLGRLRRAQSIKDSDTGGVSSGSNIDSQTPYLIKLISSAVLTENISFYFDAMLQPVQNQGVFALNEAWARYRFEGRFLASMTLGQFPSSDIILDQDTRLTIEKYQIYTQSNLGLERGARFDIDVLKYTFGLGLSNGTGVEPATIASGPGVGRSDLLFDNNNRKIVYGYLSRRFSNFKVGSFFQINQQPVISPLTRKSFQYTFGLDIQAYPTHNVNWMVQLMWNRWDEFLNEGENIQWFGGFVGIDYRATDYISYSLLFNYTNPGDFKNTGSIYEGLSANVITTTVSYYFRSNVRGILEVSMDFLPAENDEDLVGHETKEDALVIGIDISY